MRISRMEYNEIVRLAWHALGDFSTPPTQTQIDRMIKNAKRGSEEARGNIKKINNVLWLGVFSILIALFIAVAHIQANVIAYPYFTLSLIFIVLVGYHMYTLLMMRQSLKKHLLMQESIVKMASPSKDRSQLESIYMLSIENEALTRYLEDTHDRMLTKLEVDAIDTLRKKAPRSQGN